MSAPLYRRVGAVLRQRISNGTYAPGERLPAEGAFCEEFRVSRSTMRKALEDLVESGWVIRHRGRGSFVSTGITPDLLLAMVTPTFDTVHAAHEHRLLNAHLIQVRDSEIPLVDLDPSATMLRVLREKNDNRGRTLLREVNVVPAGLAPHLDLGRRHHDWTVLELLLSVGAPVSLMNITVEPAVLGEADAEVFDAAPGESTFRYISRFWSPTGRMIAATSILYRPGFYRLSVDLSVNEQMMRLGDSSWCPGYGTEDGIPSRAVGARGLLPAEHEGFA